ncbi:MAG: hypothetical protein ABIG28_01405 [archaeon]
MPDEYTHEKFLEAMKIELELEKLLSKSIFPDERNGRSQVVLERGHQIGKSRGEISEDKAIEDVPEELLTSYVEIEYRHKKNTAIQSLRKGVDNVLGDKVSDKVLEKLVLTDPKSILESADKNGREVINARLYALNLEELKRRYEKGETSPEEEKIINKHIEDGIKAKAKEEGKRAGEREAERQRNSGYVDRNLIKIAEKLSAGSYELGLSQTKEERKIKEREYALVGIKEEIEKAREEYKKIERDKGSIYAAVRKSIKAIAEGTDEERFENMRRMLYKVVEEKSNTNSE